MVERRSFSIAVANNQYTVSWSDGSLFVCGVDDYELECSAEAPNVVVFGPPGDQVELPWALETTLGATDRADFVSKVNALANRELSLSSVLGRAQLGQTVRVSGHNLGSSSAWEPASATGVDNFPSSARAMRVRSANAADDAAGAGARTVTISGLDANGAEISETVALVGLTTSSYTTAQFLRINSAEVATAGTNFGVNYNALTIEDSGATVYGNISYAESATPGATYGASVMQKGSYTVPAGYTAYLVAAECYASGSGEWAIYTHSLLNANQPRVQLFTAYKPSAGQQYFTFQTPIRIPEKTDVMLRVKFSVEAGGHFELVLIPN